MTFPSTLFCENNNLFCLQTGAAVAVQTFVRGAQARRNYAVLVVEHREAAKLENQILALQRKLDEERKARLKMEEVRVVLLLVVAVMRRARFGLLVNKRLGVLGW